MNSDFYPLKRSALTYSAILLLASLADTTGLSFAGISFDEAAVPAVLIGLFLASVYYVFQFLNVTISHWQDQLEPSFSELKRTDSSLRNLTIGKRKRLDKDSAAVTEFLATRITGKKTFSIDRARKIFSEEDGFYQMMTNVLVRKKIPLDITVQGYELKQAWEELYDGHDTGSKLSADQLVERLAESLAAIIEPEIRNDVLQRIEKGWQQQMSEVQDIASTFNSADTTLKATLEENKRLLNELAQTVDAAIGEAQESRRTEIMRFGLDLVPVILLAATAWAHFFGRHLPLFDPIDSYVAQAWVLFPIALIVVPSAMYLVYRIVKIITLSTRTARSERDSLTRLNDNARH